MDFKKPDFKKSNFKAPDVSKHLDSLKSLQSFDWRGLQKYTSPKAAEDLNVFLERLPHNVSHSLLIAAGIAWGVAGVLGLFTTVKIQALTELRAELEEAQSLQPIVPKIKDVAVNPKEVRAFEEKIKDTYKGLDIRSNGASIAITATSTAQFGQFREAIGHVQNGGSGWRVNIDRLCVGRECGQHALAASLKINKVSVDKPG
ncbi:MAG: hypothetical protein DHS20C02_18140 [Micavibrio sp.]|nr:MAG: hypothetical protein DHS20C02_18140 [Micavibrio sp.]